MLERAARVLYTRASDHMNTPYTLNPRPQTPKGMGPRASGEGAIPSTEDPHICLTNGLGVSSWGTRVWGGAGGVLSNSYLYRNDNGRLLLSIPIPASTTSIPKAGTKPSPSHATDHLPQRAACESVSLLVSHQERLRYVQGQDLYGSEESLFEVGNVHKPFIR